MRLQMRMPRVCSVRSVCAAAGGILFLLLLLPRHFCYFQRYGWQLDERYTRPLPHPRTHYQHPKEKTDAFIRASKEYSQLQPRPDKVKPWLTSSSFTQILSKLVVDDAILIIPLDAQWEPIAVNFYIMSLAPNNIKNYLFVGATLAVCDRFVAAGLNCAHHENAVLAALRVLHKVLYCTPDVLLHANPFERVSCDPRTCDLMAMFDGSAYDGSFVFAQHTPDAIAVFEKIASATRPDPRTFDLSLKQHQSESSLLKIKQLPANYVTKIGARGQSLLPKPSEVVTRRKCAVTEQKDVSNCAPDPPPDPDFPAMIQRAKEAQDWFYDGAHYFSSTSRKYLVYHNPLRQWNALAEELAALKVALAFGRILNRAVILPTFHYHCEELPLHEVLDMRDFDAVFHGSYRESTFLSHPLVSDKTRHPISRTFVIQSHFIYRHTGQDEGELYHSLITPKGYHWASQYSHGMTDREIRYIGNREDPVLHFWSLYDAFWKFEDPQQQASFEQDIHRGFTVKKEAIEGYNVHMELE